LLLQVRHAGTDKGFRTTAGNSRAVSLNAERPGKLSLPGRSGATDGSVGAAFAALAACTGRALLTGRTIAASIDAGAVIATVCGRRALGLVRHLAGIGGRIHSVARAAHGSRLLGTVSLRITVAGIGAGAGIAGANPNKVGWTAVKLGLLGFVIPFMFVYSPELMMRGSVLAVIWAFITASIGCIALGGSVQGYFTTDLKPYERAALLVAALLLIKSGLETDAIGIALLALVFFAQKVRAKKGAVVLADQRQK